MRQGIRYVNVLAEIDKLLIGFECNDEERLILLETYIHNLLDAVLRDAKGAKEE